MTIDDDTLGGALAISGAVAAAEERVRGIRLELAAANAELTSAIHAHHAAQLDLRRSLEGAIQSARAKVEEIESRLRPAREAMTNAREAFNPKFRRNVAPLRAAAGAELLAAAEAVARARETLDAVEKFGRQHGLEIGSIAILLPRNLRRIAALAGAAE